MYVENDKVKSITDICIKLMKIFINPKYKTHSLHHNIDEHCRINILDTLLNLTYNGKILIGIREEDLWDASYSPNDWAEPSDYKVILRDNSIFISSDCSNFYEQIYTENCEYSHELIDLPKSDTDMERIKFALSDREYLGIEVYYALRGKIPPTMYIRLEIDHIFTDNIKSIADNLSRIQL